MSWIIAALAGILSGIIGAMGMGGGAVLLIYLTAFTDTEQIYAQGINLVFFVPTAVVAIIIHAKNGFIRYKLLIPLITSGLPGVALGGFLRDHLPHEYLGKGFGVLLIIMALKEFLSRKNTKMRK